MKKGLRILAKISFSVILISGINFYGYGQKLKNIQEGGLWAPDNVKIDAKMTEWDTFQAANKATDLTYTVSNDDKNLYLAIQSTDQLNNNKIVGGGISFTINTDDKKREKDAFILTYPVVSRANMRGAGGGGRRRGGFGGAGGTTPPPVDTAAMMAMRKEALASAKEITVSGFKNITDSVISIYNEYGIKAAVDYDTKGNFVYELAIPLQLLNISINTPKEFAYNLKVNGIQINRGGSDARAAGGGGGGGGGFGGGRGGRGGGGGGFGRGGGGVDIQSMMAPTDFWGKYTLAKKQ